MSRLEMCRKALSEIEWLDQRFPGEPALQSVIIQLRYLIEAESDEAADRSRLDEITVGRFAMYELSNLISNDLRVLLCDIADDVRRELRRRRQM